MLQKVSFFVCYVKKMYFMKKMFINLLVYKNIYLGGKNMKKNIKKKTSKKICNLLNFIAYTASSSYSFVGPYEPKKPEKLKKSNLKKM